MADVAKFVTPKFIPDEAASVDFFGSHEPVARSIAAVIRTEPHLRVIGLLGPWGSGKSTVLRILKDDIASAPDSDSDIRFFIYDAWVHQSDPPRRSFLETLINFLIAEKLTAKELWQDDLDRLNRRVEEHDTHTTPTLTFSGKLIATSLLLFPVGLSLINPSWAGKVLDVFGFRICVLWLGAFFLFAPLLAGLGVYLWWRQTWNPFKSVFWASGNWKRHRQPFQESTIFSIFVNKAVDRVKNRVIRTPDPR